MAVSRLLSRPDRSLQGRMRSRAAHALADYSDVREFFSVQQSDIQLIDPGRLVESAFLGLQPGDDAETIVIAWLAVLPKGTDVPSVAAQLARYLNQLSHEPSLSQRRLLDLVAYVATHKSTQAQTRSGTRG